MRRFLKHAAHSRTRLFLPVVEYGLTEFAVSVRQIAPRPVIKLLGPLRSRRRTRGGILDSPELPVSSRGADEDPMLEQESAALVARLICI